ncbi:hypothetical protein [Nocardia thailandica]
MSMLWIYPIAAALVLAIVILVRIVTRNPHAPRPHGGGRRAARTTALFAVGAAVTGAAMTLTGFAGTAKRR